MVCFFLVAWLKMPIFSALSAAPRDALRLLLIRFARGYQHDASGDATGPDNMIVCNAASSGLQCWGARVEQF